MLVSMDGHIAHIAFYFCFQAGRSAHSLSDLIARLILKASNLCSSQMNERPSVLPFADKPVEEPCVAMCKACLNN